MGVGSSENDLLDLLVYVNVYCIYFRRCQGRLATCPYVLYKPSSDDVNLTHHSVISHADILTSGDEATLIFIGTWPIKT